MIDFYFFLKFDFFMYIIMQNPKSEEEEIIEDTRNLFRSKKRTK